MNREVKKPASLKSQKKNGIISKTKMLKGPSLAVVGIGASAGGFEAFKQLLSNLPSDLGMAYILIVHLDPKHGSMLTEVFSKMTSMPVIQIREGMLVESNHVYVIPPNKFVRLENGTLRLIPRLKTFGIPQSIDYFFRSLGEQQNSKAIGVILSGTASDGTEGLRIIKGFGGITIAQDPKSAKFQGMPLSAIEAGVVDLILNPEAIALELVSLAKHPLLALSRKERIQPPEDEGPVIENSIDRVLFLLRKSFPVDFTLYKQSTIKRRIERRMVLKKLVNIESYANYLLEYPEEKKALFEDILIHVTGFFRDPDAYEALKKEVFPQLIKDKSPGVPLRIWVAGCSTGEEVYSLAIALIEFLGEKALNKSIQIFGSDISIPALEKARSGEYPEGIIQDVSKERINRFFVKIEGGFRIAKFIRDLCLFTNHDVISNPPFAKINFLSCRNLLIYFTPQLQKRVIPIFHYSLNPDGFLWLGRSETIGAFPGLFTLIDKSYKIYRKKTVPLPVKLQFPFRPATSENFKTDKNSMESGNRRFELQKEVDRIIQLDYGPPSIVINDEMEVQQVRGRISSYLEVPQGEATHNLLKMARPELLSALRIAVQSAKKKNAVVRKEGIGLEENGQIRTFNIQVAPINLPSGLGERYFLILFEENSSSLKLERKSSASVKGKKESSRISKNKQKDLQNKLLAQLQQELSLCTEYQHSLVEEYETTQEELTSSNEELQSSNEELQSTNEELETAKEELQSSNEELNTVNEELQNRNGELIQINNDIINFIGSADIPLVMVGIDRKIRRFTPQASRVFNLIASDIGRPIDDIRANLKIQDLGRMVSAVIEGTTNEEINVQDPSDHWFRLQIRPYKTVENIVDGAVIALVDVDTMKRSLDEVKSNLNYTMAVVETVQLPIVVLDRELRMRQANRSFYETFGKSKKNIGSNFFFLLGEGLWEDVNLRKMIEEALSMDRPFKDLEVFCNLANREQRVLLFSGRKISWMETQPYLILLTIEDITERRRMELALLRESAEVKLLEAVAVAANEAMSVENVLQIFLDRVCAHTRWPVGHAYIVKKNSENDQIELVPSKIWHLDESGRFLSFKKSIEGLRIPPGVRLPGEILTNRKPGWVIDASSDPSLIEGNSAKVSGIKSVFAFPAMVGTEVVAVLEFFSLEMVQPDFRLLEVMSHIGPQLGRVIERKQSEVERELLLCKEQNARAEAEKVNRAKDLFLATLSHELRTPLTTILAWAQMIRMGKVDGEETKKAVNAIEQSAKLQGQLIDDLLDVSRIIMGKLTLEMRVANLSSIIEEAVNVIRPSADEKSLQIDIKIDSSVNVINVDAARLKQVIWNLLANSIKFTPRGGKIQVIAEKVQEKSGDTVQIKVSDTGKGISPDFLPHIFDSFSQEDSTATRKNGGLGLGLAIVRNLMELLKGAVRATSPGEGKGTTIILSLPLNLEVGPIKSANPTPALPVNPGQRKQGAPKRPKNKDQVQIHDQVQDQDQNKINLNEMRILFVDDDPNAREMFAVLLRSFGAEVAYVQSAEEALTKLGQFRPHILISDISMPGEDGISLIRKIRALPAEECGQIPAVALTAFASVEDREQALSAGFNVHLAKPVDTIHLASAIAKLVGRK